MSEGSKIAILILLLLYIIIKIIDNIVGELINQKQLSKIYDYILYIIFIFLFLEGLNYLYGLNV